MIQEFITREGNDRLLLFFAGWGADSKPFAGLRPAGRDFMVCYDYTDTSFDSSLLQGYRRIDVVAWSLGVWTAATTLAGLGIEPHTSIAINGTMHPVDSTRGIAPEIFSGTLRTLSASTLVKFRRRMCGGSEGYRDFMQCAPDRSLQSMADELAAIGERYSHSGATDYRWSKAVVGTADAIFPTPAQLTAWAEEGVETISTDAPHYSKELFTHYLQEIWTNN
jgi:hypothetical protein